MGELDQAGLAQPSGQQFSWVYTMLSHLIKREIPRKGFHSWHLLMTMAGNGKAVVCHLFYAVISIHRDWRPATNSTLPLPGCNQYPPHFLLFLGSSQQSCDVGRAALRNCRARQSEETVQDPLKNNDIAVLWLDQTQNMFSLAWTLKGCCDLPLQKK